jgi:lipopolysaccharide transport system permease protein
VTSADTPQSLAASTGSGLPALFRYRSLVYNLALKDLKLKYRDSLLGVCWSLLNPLLTLGVYTFAFHTVLKVRMEHYAFFLLVSLLPWNFFSTSLVASTGAILQNAHLIRKVNFPREVLPVSTVLFSLAQMLLAFAVFLPLLAFARRLPLGWTLLLFFPLLCLHVLFTTGLALILAPLTAVFRDIAHLTEVALLLLFWLTPIVYPVTMAPERLQPFLEASPIAAFTIAYQDVLFFARFPEPLVFSSILVSTALSLTLGLLVFSRFGPGLAERV